MTKAIRAGRPSPARSGQVPRHAQVVVIGGGPAGRAAAAAAVRSGKTVVLFSSGATGWSAGDEVLALVDAARRGLRWGAAGDAIRDARSQAARRARTLADPHGVQVIPGWAVLTGGGRQNRTKLLRSWPGGPYRLQITEEGVGGVQWTMTADRLVIAAGSRPLIPELRGIGDTRYLTADTVGQVFDLPEAPYSMVVLGAGSTGCAVAQALARLGANITLIDAERRVLAAEGTQASDAVQLGLKRDGVKTLLGSPAISLAPTLDGGAWVGTEDGGNVAAERLVITAGWTAATRGLGLERLGVPRGPRGDLAADSGLKVGDRIWAAGSVLGWPPHPAAAVAMGSCAGHNVWASALLGRGVQVWNARGVSWVTATEPVVARVGLPIEQALGVSGTQLGESHLTSGGESAPLVGPEAAPQARAVVAGRWSRHDTRARLVGVTVIGPGAGEAAALAALTTQAHLDAKTLAEMVGAEGPGPQALIKAVGRAL